MRGLLHAFSYALRGLRYLLRTGRNFRLQLCAALYVLWTGWMARLSPAEWAVELLCCAAVLSAEGLNTALELLADRVTRERDALIGQAKDCAAGAVLLLSLGAAAVWLVITLGGGHHRAMLGWLLGAPWRAALFALSVPAALFWALRADTNEKR